MLPTQSIHAAAPSPGRHEEMNKLIDRLLQDSRSSDERGRYIFTVLYLTVLAFCFLMPVLYYIRCYMEARQEQRLARLEAERLRMAIERSSEANRAESLAVKRKYNEERRARILQLMGPVRMTLKEENFIKELPAEEHPTLGNEYFYEDSDDEEAHYAIRVPTAGLYVDETPTTRLVPATCTICLTSYSVDTDIVWSSNKLCDHVFHVECAEQWLMRQREGPLCPCCRRDFVVDPYDIENGDNVFDEGNFQAESLDPHNPELARIPTASVDEEQASMPFPVGDGVDGIGSDHPGGGEGANEEHQ